MPAILQQIDLNSFDSSWEKRSVGISNWRIADLVRLDQAVMPGD